MSDIICSACKGAGTIIVPSRKYSIKPELDPWDCKGYDGHKYHIRVCKRCKGLGVI